MDRNNQWKTFIWIKMNYYLFFDQFKIKMYKVGFIFEPLINFFKQIDNIQNLINKFEMTNEFEMNNELRKNGFLSLDGMFIFLINNQAKNRSNFY
jgi:hypothetical protein